MDILSIRAMLRTKTIYDIPLRVTYYARVSSDSDEQLNSLDNQISYYENFIKKNKAWTFVPGYIDEGLSGISTKKRKHFNEMIADAKDGMFDLIITKEISRFARNTLDSLQHTRELLACGVGVFFQNDNINTLDEDAELQFIDYESTEGVSIYRRSLLFLFIKASAASGEYFFDIMRFSIN